MNSVIEKSKRSVQKTKPLKKKISTLFKKETSKKKTNPA